MNYKNGVEIVQTASSWINLLATVVAAAALLRIGLATGFGHPRKTLSLLLCAYLVAAQVTRLASSIIVLQNARTSLSVLECALTCSLALVAWQTAMSYTSLRRDDLTVLSRKLSSSLKSDPTPKWWAEERAKIDCIIRKLEGLRSA